MAGRIGIVGDRAPGGGTAGRHGGPFHETARQDLVAACKPGFHDRTPARGAMAEAYLPLRVRYPGVF